LVPARKRATWSCDLSSERGEHTALIEEGTWGTTAKDETKAFARSRDERKRVEMRFAHLKTHHGFERMRLRGLSGARDEFHLPAIVQNLKTLALRILGPPVERTTALVV
jgi:Transposase DDE domain